MSFGSPRIHFRLLDSTNERGRELARAGAPHGTVITATEQAAGRGRQGRTWAAPPGAAILCSVVVREHPRMLPLCAGMAVAELTGPDARVKWPNDVLLAGRKVAGILVEGRPQEGWAVVGIGVNVALTTDELPVELRDASGGIHSYELAISRTDLPRRLERLELLLRPDELGPAEEHIQSKRATRSNGGRGPPRPVHRYGRRLRWGRRRPRWWWLRYANRRGRRWRGGSRSCGRRAGNARRKSARWSAK